jgi:tetratricopeptide (TPR) repeat protein
VVLYYLRLAFWPYPLCLDYGWLPAERVADIAIPSVAILLLIGLTIAAYWKWPAYGFLGSAFFLILAPSSSIVPILDLAVEHRMYLPLAALIAAAVFAARVLILGRSRDEGRRMGIALGGVLLVALALGVGTWLRNQVYHDELALWTDVVSKRPANPRGHMARGFGLEERQRLAEGIDEYRQAIEIKPNFTEARHNLAIALLKTGDLDGALEQLYLVLKLRPGHVTARNTLGNVLYQRHKFADAARYYEEAIAMEPGYAEAHFNLGRARVQQGDLEAAVNEYRKALEARPDLRYIVRELGLALAAQGEFIESAPYIAEAIERDPNFAEGHNILGMACLLAGRGAESIEHFRRALDLQPGNSNLAFNLAHALYQAGRTAEAEGSYQRALKQDPSWPQTANRLAWSLATSSDAKARNGALACLLAEEACEATGFQRPEFLDTLAAAYAETGRYPEAVATLQKALAHTSANDQRRAQMEERIQLYRSRRPFRVGSARK